MDQCVHLRKTYRGAASLVRLAYKNEVAVCDDALCCSQSLSDKIVDPSAKNHARDGTARYGTRAADGWKGRHGKVKVCLLGETDNEV